MMKLTDIKDSVRYWTGRVVLAAAGLLMTASAHAGIFDWGSNDVHVGGVDYSWHLKGLMTMVSYVTAVMTATLGIVYSIGAIVSIISATQIYIKMNTGEEGFTKNVMYLVGGVIFMLVATIALPAFFGWDFQSFDYGMKGNAFNPPPSSPN